MTNLNTTGQKYRGASSPRRGGTTFYTLPLPPSVNAWLRFGKGRAYTETKYKRWRDEAVWLLLGQGLKSHRFSGEKIVLDCWWTKGRKNQDVHNFHKALCDCVMEVIGIDDSHYLVRDQDYSVNTKNPHVKFLIYSQIQQS